MRFTLWLFYLDTYLRKTIKTSASTEKFTAATCSNIPAYAIYQLLNTLRATLKFRIPCFKVWFDCSIY